jgi:ribosomal protein L31E
MGKKNFLASAVEINPKMNTVIFSKQIIRIIPGKIKLLISDSIIFQNEIQKRIKGVNGLT